MSDIQIPRPGEKVRGSTSGQPIMVLFDLLSRRWAMGIIWQLDQRTLNFRELRAACENVSPSVLNTRLKELRRTGLVDHGDDGYYLTAMGQELLRALKPLGAFAKSWVTTYE